jgi:murein L,D-transpeptidase YafK
MMRWGKAGAVALIAVAAAGWAWRDFWAPPARSAETVAQRLDTRLTAKGLTRGAPVFIRIFKRSRELEVWLRKGRGFRLLHTYPICTFSGTLGPKTRRGDLQAPEGFYRVRLNQLNPHSRFHLSFNLGYPNAYDQAHGRTGDYLMVHGDCVSIGCYAMTDKGIEEIYTLVEAALRGGQDAVPVHIFPFRMTAAAMRKAARSRWIGFWRNLKQGHDLFRPGGRPPGVGVSGKRYVFRAG